VLFRFRTYQVTPGKLEAFDSFFLTRLLPLQKRHGARLVGRWRAETDSEVTAVWAYRDRADYERIDSAVRNDPQMAAAHEARARLGPLYDGVEEVFAVSTLPLAETELAHLERPAS
jgi:8-oxo-dGTP diphosphatase